MLCSPVLKANPFYAINGLSQATMVISAGYFLYDAFVCLTREEGLQYVVHALVCCWAFFTAAITGNMQYWGTC